MAILKVRQAARIGKKMPKPVALEESIDRFFYGKEGRPTTFIGRYEKLECSTKIDQVLVIRKGVPAEMLELITSDMGLPRNRVFSWVGIAPATGNRKIKKRLRLSVHEGEQTLGLARLIGQVERAVKESGDPTGFDPATWTARWLDTPNPALGGEPPGKFMDTAPGRELVSSLIGRMQTGVYA